MESSQGKKCLVVIHCSSLEYTDDSQIHVGENNKFLPLKKSTDVPLASSASNEKKSDSSHICDY